MLSFIKATNFKKLVNFQATFTEGTNLVLGDNGMGKTTLFNVVRFALFGTASIAARAENIPTWGHKNCLVKVGFTNDFLVVRSLKDCKIYRAGDNGSLTENPELKVAEGNTPCTLWVKEHLGLDHKMFSIFNMSMQGETGALITLGAPELNRIVENFSGVGVLDKVITSLSKEKSNLEGAAGTLEHTDIKAREKQATSVKSQITEKVKQSDFAKVKVNTAHEGEIEANRKYKEAVTHNSVVDQQSTKKSSIEATLEVLNPQKVDLDSKVGELTLQVNVEDHTKNNASATALQLKLKDFNISSTKHTKLETKLESEKSNLAEYLANARLELSVKAQTLELETTITDHESTVSRLTTISDLGLRHKEARSKHAESSDKTVLETEVNLKKLSLNSSIKEQSVVCQTAYDVLTQAQGDLRSANEVVKHGSCDKCHRVFEQFDEEAAKLTAKEALTDFEEATERSSAAVKTLNSLQTELNGLPNHGVGNAEQAIKWLNSADELRLQLNELSQNWTSFEDEQLTSAKAFLADSRGALKALPNHGTGNSEKAAACQNEASLIEASIEALETRWAEFDDEAAETKLQALRSQIQHFKTFSHQLAETRDNLAHVNTKILAAQTQLEAIVIPEKLDADALSAEHTRLTSVTGQLRESLTNATQELTGLKTSAALEESELSRIRTNNENFAKYNVGIDKTKRLMKFLRDKRTNYMEGVWSLILGAATGWINKTTQGWVTAVGRDHKSGDFTFTENGIVAPVYSGASGAQKEFIGVALRIGLGMSLQGDSSMLMLDEPTAGMSEDNADRLATGLLSISGQKIIITHRQSERLTAGKVINL